MLRLDQLQTPNTKEFRVLEQNWHGCSAILINPCVKNPSWTETNKWFRSSIWDTKTQRALSLGFPKFFNYNENNTQSADISKYTLVEKKDGSLCIVDWINDTLSVRPRGSFDTAKHINQEEQTQLFLKYDLANLAKKYAEYSILFELVSPVVPIIVKYKVAELFLIGMIHKTSGLLVLQSQLDQIAQEAGVLRPKVWDTQGKSKTEIIETITNLQEQEGFCAYDVSGQSIIKLKCKWYLSLHSFKSHCTYTEIVNWFCTQWELHPENTEEATLEYIRGKLDWECAEIARPMITKVKEHFQPIRLNLESAEKLVEEFKHVEAKEFAKILDYNKHLKSFAFTLFHGKKVTSEQIKRILQKSLNNELHVRPEIL